MITGLFLISKDFKGYHEKHSQRIPHGLRCDEQTPRRDGVKTYIYFIGAGPGDPELITVKGKAVIEKADLIIYAGSLVNPEILRWRKPGAVVLNSAEMDLQEIVSAMMEAHAKKKITARVHTGDPAIYGAIGEQMEMLEEAGIVYDVIPGVSSFLGAAAALKKELTIPDGTQTIILTRQGGRTKTPEREKLSSLAAHQSSLVLFLSVGMAKRVQEELLTAYPPETPFAVVVKATWKDQKIFRGKLKDLSKTVARRRIKKTALIFLGKFLESRGERSKLYDKDFSHEFRKKRKRKYIGRG